jgi:RNA polymerase sigma-70 factor (ECF subfamily)
VTDDELMGRVARGDEEAARLLVERWQTPVFAFHLRMVGSREDAQDLGQETFIRLFRHADRYRQSGQFRSWFFKIAGNLARSHLRRRRVLSWVPFSPGQHDTASPDKGPNSRVEETETQVAVRRALAQLPERQRRAIVLRSYQGLSYREISLTMGVSVPAVESLLQRGMAALGKKLAGLEVKR